MRPERERDREEEPWRAGGCHCGAVRFEAAIPEGAEAQACNCSMCAKLGFIHLIVPESRFRIVRGEDALTEYTFNTGVAKHLFCATCGVKAFYRPRSNPNGWSVNLHALDAPEAVGGRIVGFDGKNWEANAAALAHLSQE
jgi:hypothetical protein